MTSNPGVRRRSNPAVLQGLRSGWEVEGGGRGDGAPCGHSAQLPDISSVGRTIPLGQEEPAAGYGRGPDAALDHDGPTAVVGDPTYGPAGHRRPVRRRGIPGAGDLRRPK